jgi:maleylacetate reductase
VGADRGRSEAHRAGQLAGRLGAPRSLRELGTEEDDIPRIAELAVANPYANPRPVTRDGIQPLLWAAWTGALPPATTATTGRTHRTERRT